MADKRVVIVDVKSNLREETRAAKDLNKELTKAKSASRTGSRAADAALGTSGFSETGLRRGASGAGGRGDSRDFARQAQGLGGLVHVYATFAANVFAVSAAFNAMNRAMNTELMLKSADALSARYGVALKGVANSIREVTDNALSMRQAIEFSNLGGAAGLTTDQMARLATVAKSASQALGRDLADSMNRVYKGAIKIEPELLDEIGIMVKVDQATAEYARTVGKAASQLTDFERRQAFVNAVTEQGARKFQDISGQVNSFSKLTSALTDLQDGALGALNKGVAPLVDLLASSPTALIAAVGVVIAKLTKMALPNLIPNIDAKMREASQTMEAASKAYSKATKDVMSAWEDTNALKFISADKTAMSKNLDEIGDKLRDSLVEDIEKVGPVKLSVDSENLKKSYQAALEKSLKSTEQVLKRSNLTDVGREGALERKRSLEELLDTVKNLDSDLSGLARLDKEQAAQAAAYSQARIASMRAQAQQQALALQQQGQHIAALKVTWNTERAITQEKIAQAAAAGANTLMPRATGFARAVGRTVETLGGSLMMAVSRMGMLGMGIGIVAAGFAGLNKLMLHFGLRSKDMDGLLKSAKALDEQVKSLADSNLKLQSAGNFADVFDFKLGNLKLANSLMQGLADNMVQLDNTMNSRTNLDRAIDKFVDAIPLMDSSMRSVRESAAAAATDLIKLLDPKELATSLETIKKEARSIIVGGIQSGSSRVPAGRANKEIQLFEAIIDNATSFEEVLERVDDFGRRTLRMSGKELEEFSAQMMRTFVKDAKDAGKNLAEQAGFTEQAQTATKDLNDAVKDLINSQTKQTDLTKIQNATLSGLAAASTNYEAFEQFVRGLTPELAAVAGIDFDESIRKATELVDVYRAALEDPKLTETGRQSLSNLIKEAMDAIRKPVEDFANSVNRTASRLMMDKVAREISAAQRSASRRSAGAVEGLTGVSFGAAQRAQRDAIDNQQAILQDLRLQLENNQRSITTNLPSMSGVNLNSLGELATILQKEVRVDPSDPTGSVEAQRTAAEFATIRQYVEARVGLLGSLNSAIAGQPTRVESIVAKLADEKSFREFNLNLEKEQQELTLRRLNSINDQLLGLESINIYQEENQKLVLESKDLHNQILTTQGAINSLKGDESSTYVQMLEQNKKLLNDKLTQVNLEAQSLDNLKGYLDLQKKITSELKVINGEAAYYEELSSDVTLSFAEQAKALTGNIEALKERSSLEVKLANARIAELQRLQSAEKDQGKQNELRLELRTEELTLMTSELALRKEINDLERLAINARMGADEEGVTGVFSKGYIKDLSDYALNYINDLKLESKSIGATFAEGMIGAFDSIGDKFIELIQTGEMSFKTFGDFVKGTFSDVFADLAKRIMKDVIWTILERASKSMTASSGGGGSGILGTIFGAVVGGLTGGMTNAMAGAANMSSDPIGSFIGMHSTFSANGNVMTPMGPLKLEKYARGGIASSPQVSVFGEGRKNEAYVPLPDNRTIPVTLSGGGGSNVTMGDTNITVTVEGGNTTTSVEESSEFGKRLSEAIKFTVNDELIRQSRPGGMLYKGARQ